LDLWAALLLEYLAVGVGISGCGGWIERSGVVGSKENLVVRRMGRVSEVWRAVGAVYVVVSTSEGKSVRILHGEVSWPER
jgi:hypothetical protein